MFLERPAIFPPASAFQRGTDAAVPVIMSNEVMKSLPRINISAGVIIRISSTSAVEIYIVRLKEARNDQRRTTFLAGGLTCKLLSCIFWHPV